MEISDNPFSSAEVPDIVHIPIFARTEVVEI